MFYRTELIRLSHLEIMAKEASLHCERNYCLAALSRAFDCAINLGNYTRDSWIWTHEGAALSSYGVLMYLEQRPLT
jgi:hypothetical protein